MSEGQQPEDGDAPRGEAPRGDTASDVARERDRLETLRRLDLLAPHPEPAFDHVSRQAARLLDVPVAYVSLLDGEKQYVKSCVGLPDRLGSGRSSRREQSFCQFPVSRRETVAFDDLETALDLDEFPLLRELGLRAYAGAPIVLEETGVVGTMCVASEEPREWTARDRAALEDFAESVAAEIGLRLEVERRREAESAAAAREAEFRTLVEQGTDVVTVLGPDGAIRYESPSLERVLGWQPEELVGREVAELIHPEDRERVMARLAEAMERPEGVFLEEFRFRHANGSWRWIQSTARRLPAQASWDGLLAMSRDVTERRELTRRLRVLDRAVESLTEGVVVTEAELDRPGPEITYVNPAMSRLTGYDRQELVGVTPRVLQGPKTDEDVIRRLRAAIERGEAFTGETVNYRKDGTNYVVRWTISPVRDESGEIIRYVAVQRDVTDERRARERLEQEVAERTADVRRARKEVLERLARAAESIARHHHERWDGRGYPEGLSGESIPLEARIVAVVDAFDALVHERPYKEAWSVDDALAEIRRGAGTRYDPRVVDAFVDEMEDQVRRMLEEGPEALAIS